MANKTEAEIEDDLYNARLGPENIARSHHLSTSHRIRIQENLSHSCSPRKLEQDRWGMNGFGAVRIWGL
jgi:hypothetical protein